MNSRLVVVSALVLAGFTTGCKRMKPPEFSLVFLDAKGQELSANQAQPGACVLDRKTGLVWEQKTENGPRAGKYTYTWFNPDEATNNGHPGVENGGTCTGTRCDTLAFVQGVNKERLCGFDDWRLPTRDELGTVVDYSIPYPGPTVPKGFFPNMSTESYWTGSLYAPHYSGVWAWRLDYGYDYVAKKDERLHIILVRGKPTVPMPKR